MNSPGMQVEEYFLEPSKPDVAIVLLSQLCMSSSNGQRPPSAHAHVMCLGRDSLFNHYD